jgi:potassium-transporting ATPase potassium-binding subunit
MTLNGWLQISVFFLVVLAATKPLGIYMYRVFESAERPSRKLLAPIERGLLRLCGVSATDQQTWVEYAISLLVFSVIGIVVTYAIQRLQAHLPFNPQGLPAPSPDLAFNTAVSFATNTNWQSYGGESTMSYLTQMAGLAWHNFTSAAAGLGVALVLARGLTRRPSEAGPAPLGNFFVDLIRGTVYLLLPISLVLGLVLVSQGVIQHLGPYLSLTTLEGASQVIPMGPVGSQEVIKELGTNGGGFFNANSAHPFENPSAITNFLEMLLILLIPAGLTYTFGRMAGSPRQGWSLFGAMAIMFLAGVLICYSAETHPNPALAGLPLDQSAGNLEGKEVRFGVVNSALWATITTDTSCGAVNSMHDSYTPLGGLVPLVNLKLGEVIFGGVGAGLYGILIFVLLSVFIAGLMVGRTPEYLGKKIEGREMKAVMLYALVFPLLILSFSAWAAVSPSATSSLNNAGPHGLSEILYAFTSAAANNGSAFAGLNTNTLWWNTTMGLVMLGGRFLMMIPVLAIAGFMARKRVVPAGPGTFPTNGPLFTGLLISVVLVVGALTFFPALCLGPVVEHFLAAHGRLF